MPRTTWKHWFASSVLLLLGSRAHAAVPPGGYVQNFDNEATCGTACGTPCVMADVIWSNAAGDGTDWTVDAGGTTSANTGPSGDHTTGAGNYAYVEASTTACYPAVEAHLVTTDILLDADHNYRFEFWYHLYGADLGTIHVDIDPDGGADSFTTVLSLSDNIDLWQFQRIDLSAYAAGADATINIRVRGVTGTSFASDVAIDDLFIEEYPDNDVGVVSIDSPANVGCDLGQETVSVTVSNDGALAQTMFPIAFAVDGGDPITETFDAVLDPGATATYTFVMPAELSVLGAHTLDVYTALATDMEPSNDAASLSVHNGTPVTAFPYREDFETANVSPWISGGANSSWALGTPQGLVITGAASGLMAWVTNLAGNYNASENSWVESQCGFDLSGMSNPAVRMAIWWESELSWDGANLQASVDGGGAWTDVGVLGDPYNWYNDGTINGSPGGSQVGWTGRNGAGSNGWVPAVHALDGMAGAGNVSLRVAFGADTIIQDEGFGVDDIEIFDDVNSLQAEGRGPRPRLSALAGGAANVLTLAFWTEALGQDQTIDTVTVSNGGTLQDVEISAVRLWLDDGDQVFDPVFDTQVGVDQVFVDGVTTFPAGVQSSKWIRQYMFVTVDIDQLATAGTVFENSIADALAFEVASGDPVTLRNPVVGPQHAIYGLVDSLPFTDDVGDATPINRVAVWGAGDYPAAAAAGPAVATATTVADSLVDLGDARTAPGPNSAPYMGVFGFPNGPAAGAIDYAFDLGTYAAADDLVWLRFAWNNTGQEDDDLSNVFVSTDGGATWNASLYRWDFTAPVAEGWNTETLDLSAALAGAGVDFSSDMRIRFQAGGDEASPVDGLQVDDIWLGEPQETTLSRDAAGIANGATDDVGEASPGPVTLTYTIENTGHLPLDIDAASFASANDTNVANISVTPPAINPIEPGTTQTFDVQFDVTDVGAFSFDISFTSDDPRLTAGAFGFVVSGVGTEPDLAVSRDGNAVASGATDDVGTVSAEAQTLTYTLENVGSTDLVIAGVATGGANNVSASISMQPASNTLAPGATTTFAVEYTAGESAFSFDVTIDSDDADSPYTFTVSGAGEVGPVSGGGCCSGSSGGSPAGGLLLALFVGLLLCRPRRNARDLT